MKPLTNQEMTVCLSVAKTMMKDAEVFDALVNAYGIPDEEMQVIRDNISNHYDAWIDLINKAKKEAKGEKEWVYSGDEPDPLEEAAKVPGQKRLES